MILIIKKVISFLFGLIYFRLNLNQKGVQNIAGVLFLCVTNNSFGSLFVVVNVRDELTTFNFKIILQLVIYLIEDVSG